jgi:hypothetical protein
MLSPDELSEAIAKDRARDEVILMLAAACPKELKCKHCDKRRRQYVRMLTNDDFQAVKFLKCFAAVYRYINNSD